MRHEMKSWPEKFKKILANQHMQEIRIKDREYEVGDEILMREFTRDNHYTGQEVLVDVVEVHDGKDFPWPPPVPIIEKIIRDEYRKAHAASMRMRRQKLMDKPEFVIIGISLKEVEHG